LHTEKHSPAKSAVKAAGMSSIRVKAVGVAISSLQIFNLAHIQASSFFHLPAQNEVSVDELHGNCILRELKHVYPQADQGNVVYLCGVQEDAHLKDNNIAPIDNHDLFLFRLL
jgi:hypothetical protein